MQKMAVFFGAIFQSVNNTLFRDHRLQLRSTCGVVCEAARLISKRLAPEKSQLEF